jgi:hypothetical protein
MYKQATSNIKNSGLKQKVIARFIFVGHFKTFGIEGDKGRPFFYQKLPTCCKFFVCNYCYNINLHIRSDKASTFV